MLLTSGGIHRQISVVTDFFDRLPNKNFFHDCYLYLCFKEKGEIMNPHHHRGLYRSSNQAIIGGVAAGIAEHLNTDPTIIRIIFAIVALFGGGIIIYIILWIALPAYETNLYEASRFYSGSGQSNYNKTSGSENESKENSDQGFTPPFQDRPRKKHTENGGFIAGVFMIVIGLIFLADRFFYIGFRHLWPLLLLVVGILLIKSAYNRPDQNDPDNNERNNDHSNNQILK